MPQKENFVVQGAGLQWLRYYWLLLKIKLAAAAATVVLLVRPRPDSVECPDLGAPVFKRQTADNCPLLGPCNVLIAVHVTGRGLVPASH